MPLTAMSRTLIAVATVALVTVPLVTEAGRRAWAADQDYQEMRARDESRALLGKKHRPTETPGGRRTDHAQNPAQGPTAWGQYQDGGVSLDQGQGQGLDQGEGPKPEQFRGTRRSAKPNIIFVITDDQDVELGSMNFMPKTQRLLQEKGAIFTNAFVTTPMCCPSRSSMLTGMYVHNHNVYTNNDNCSSPQWRQNYETRNFGTYLTNAGYRTGYFGKYLNEYDGEHIPPGWVEWVGLIKNTRFYNYSLNFNGKKIKHLDSYRDDYLTDLIANDSVTFLKQSKQYFPNRPVAMVLSMPAPHGPEDAAPQYQHLFQNVTTHRTPSWNVAPNPDKQWILQYTGKMEPIHIAFTDLLHQKRLQTLQSVDDAVEKMVNELRLLGELDNTYFLYTSDHGYHLGQYGIIKGKAFPYDFDIRVPFLMRGPRIPAGVTVKNIVLNVDIAPTLLDIAGVATPEHMDGKSIMELFDDAETPGSVIGGVVKRKKAWRDSFLVERGKITKKKMMVRERIEAERNRLVLSKQGRLEDECQKPEYQAPCSGKQQWACSRNLDGKLRIFKCRYSKKAENEAFLPGKCECPPPIKIKGGIHDYDGLLPGDPADLGARGERLGRGPPSRDRLETEAGRLQRAEKKRQRQFLFDHVNQPDRLKPRFIREKRSLDSDLDDWPPTEGHRDPDGMSDQTTGEPDASLIGHEGSPPEMFEHYDSEDDYDNDRQDTGHHDNDRQDAGHHDNDRQEPSHHDNHHHDSDTQEMLAGSEHFANPEGDSDPQRGVMTSDEEGRQDRGLSPDPPGIAPVDGRAPPVDPGFQDPSNIGPALETVAFEVQVSYENPDGFPVVCRVLPNKTVLCERALYDSFNLWKTQKERLDEIIKEMKDKLDQLKDVKKQLQAQRPGPEDYDVTADVTGTDDVTDDVGDFADESDDGSFEYESEDEGDPYQYPLGGADDSETDAQREVSQLFEEFAEEDPDACDCDVMGDQPIRGQRRVKRRNPRLADRRERKRERKQLKREEKRQQRREEKEQRKETEDKERQKPEGDSSAAERDVTDPTRDCHSDKMKCFTHDNDHWKTAPYWDSEGGGDKPAYGRRNDPACDSDGLECSRMDNDHWKVEPKWRYGPFCFCPNSNNNTYWCVRSVNETHNFLYCEFITGFISYYDMTKDPYQLRNAVHDLTYGTLQELHVTLEKLKSCRGTKECTVRYRPPDPETDVPRKRRRKARRDKTNKIIDPSIWYRAGK